MRAAVVAGAALALLAVAVPGAGAAAGGGDAAFSSPYTFLAGVSCPSASFCMAVGAAADADNQLRTLAERWNGTAWHIVPTLNQGGPRTSSEMWSVSCVSPASCMAVGDAQGGAVPLAEQWNGAAWSLLRTPFLRDGRDATLASVSCTAPAACVAAGSRNNHSGITPATLIERWNGLRWALVPSPNPPGAIDSALWGISCAAAGPCTAVGDYSVTAGSTSETTLVERGSGSSWTVLPSPGVAGRGTALYGVSCGPGSGCTAVGARYQQTPTNFAAFPLVERESGGQWRVATTPHPAGTSYDGFGGVACTSASCIATGSARSPSAITTLVESSTGGPWSIVPSPDAPGTLNGLGSISCPSAGLCMAVGDNDNGTGLRLPLAEQWNGTAWTIVPVPVP